MKIWRKGAGGAVLIKLAQQQNQKQVKRKDNAYKELCKQIEITGRGKKVFSFTYFAVVEAFEKLINEVARRTGFPRIPTI